MRNAARLVTLSLCFALAGCPERNPPVDAGRDAGRDAPTVDVRIDAPMPGDGGPVDGGGEDTGDAAMDDAGMTDTGVPMCGDGMTNGDEDCDLSDLGLNTCETEGFDSGTLECADDCTFDTTACVAFTCGDGTRNGTEMCDGTDLGKNTCGSAGFDGGTLSCAADCTLVTTACTECGDGTLEGTEVCDGTNLNGATCVSEGFASGTLACSATCALDTSGCVAFPAPTAGQIVITEIMPNPRTISDNDGEWFEVRNTSAGPLQLQDCVFSDNQATPSTFTVTGSLVIAAGAYASFARTADAGFTPTYIYGSWNLANADDQIMLTCGGVMIDQVTYGTSAVWHFGDGIATSLNPSMTTAAANDSATNWCAATAQYEASGPNLGTPGAANPACVVSVPEVCTGGIDEDGDTFIDCLDSDCATDPACVVTTPELCTGGIDEDGDTFIDCADSDCASNPACRTPSGALFFSEYIEGSSNNKAIEIWNDSTTARDLTGCSVRLYTNGSSTSSSMVALTATIAPGDVFVICNSGATLFSDAPGGVCDIDSGVTGFNGNDAIELVCGTTTLDVIGQIGNDPGTTTGWSGGTPTVSTVNQTVRRRCSVTAGDANGADAFDPSIQWSSFPIDTVADLGTGSCAP